MNLNWTLWAFVTGLSAVLLFVSNLITRDPVPEAAAWVISSPLAFTLFLLLFGFPSFLLAVYSCVRMVRKYRRSETLGLQLASVLAAMAAIPVVLVYQSSSAAIQRNIDSWFDVELEKVFDEGLEIARWQVDRSLDELETQARAIAREYNAFDPRSLRSYAVEYGLVDIEIVGGQILVTRELRRDVDEFLLEISVPIETVRPGQSQTYLRVTAQPPIWLDLSIKNLSKGRAEVAKLRELRRSLKTTFVVSLTITALAVVFVSVSLAALIGEAMSRPLIVLASALRAVGRGDFSKRLPIKGRGEIATIMRSFGAMSDRLSLYRKQEEKAKREIEEHKSYLQSLLQNLSAGVIVLEADGRANEANAAACSLLGVPDAAMKGKPVDKWTDASQALLPFTECVQRLFAAAHPVLEEIALGSSWLSVRMQRMPQSAGGRFVLVINDITQEKIAGEEKAWRDALETLAHEIKNPLTPIRLAAERIERKFAGRLCEEDSQSISKYVRTIIGQVDSMSEMVDMQRLGYEEKVELKPLDLNGTLAESLELYRYRGNSIVCSFDLSAPRVLGNPILIRRMVINLVNNSLEAEPGGRSALIDIRTERKHNHASIMIKDNCGGIPNNILDNVFESRMTTKPKGRGLGLPIVKRIAEQMNGSVRIVNRGDGLLTTINLPLADD